MICTGSGGILWSRGCKPDMSWIHAISFSFLIDVEVSDYLSSVALFVVCLRANSELTLNSFSRTLVPSAWHLPWRTTRLFHLLMPADWGRKSAWNCVSVRRDRWKIRPCLLCNLISAGDSLPPPALRTAAMRHQHQKRSPLRNSGLRKRILSPFWRKTF